MTAKLAIIVEHRNGQVNPVLYELLSMAEKIKSIETCDIDLVIVEGPADSVSEKVSKKTGYNTVSITVLGLTVPGGTALTDILSHLFSSGTYEYICAPHSITGMDYAPALAAALHAGCLTSVEDVAWSDGRIEFKRSIYGGKLTASFSKKTGPLVITVLPGSFKPVFPDSRHAGKISRTTIESNQKQVVYTGTRQSDHIDSGLDSADVVISGGRGIGDADNYRYIEMLADLFPRSAMGASRPICDYGWASYSRQVGMTGSTVSPKLYIACGISGASQHVGGIKGSQFIVAINTDPDAPIFQTADICIVADLITFIELFDQKIKQNRQIGSGNC